MVPLNGAAQAAVEALKNDTKFVLPRMNARSLARCFKLDAKRAGIVGGSVHSLRHTFCSQLVMAGKPMRAIQVLAGHASVKTTERYASLAPDWLSGVVEAVEL